MADLYVWQEEPKGRSKPPLRLTTACNVLDSRQIPFVLGPLPSVCVACIPQWCIAITLFSKAANGADAQTYCLECVVLCCILCSASLTLRRSSETTQHISHCCNKALQLCGPFFYRSRDCPTSAHVETVRACKTATRCLKEQRQYVPRNH